MMIRVALLIVCSVMGALAQQQAACTPPTFTAHAVAIVQFKVYDSYHDAANQVTYNKNINGDDWMLIDTTNHVAYQSDGKTCQKTQLQGDLSASVDDIFRDAKYEYGLNPQGGIGPLSAWSYNHGNLTANGLFNSDCVSMISNVAIDGVPVLINLLTDIVTDNPNIDPLTEKRAWAQANC